MKNSITETARRTNRLAWLITPLLLMVMAIAGGVSVFMAHAAPATTSPLSGHYDFRGLTTSGPKNGVYITGQIQIVVTGTTVQGHLCGLNVSSIPSNCTVITGTATDTTVDLTINSVANFPVIHAIGTFTDNLIHKGASGFEGTYTVGSGASISSGNWTGLNTAVPSIAGSWDYYSVVQQGKEKGYQVHGTIILVPHANDTYTGLLCIQTNSPCIPVKGTYQYSYIRLYIGNPAEIVLRGTYTFSGEHVASGRFYSTDKTSGDKGYWLMHRNDEV